MSLRCCPHCGGLAQRGFALQPFGTALMEMPVISCKAYSASICLPESKIEAAWNRRDSDQLFLDCIPIIRVMILLLADHQIDPSQEVDLLTRIILHLKKAGA